jgi:pyridoxine 5'-phosphate synthase PdxJ
MEAAEIAILPYFTNDGGLDSERVFMKQLVQKYIKSETDTSLFNEVKTEDMDNVDNITW